jgi:uncharacterized protein with NRDE domain
MCLVAFAYRSDPRYDLVLIANRDEYFNRPAEPAHFWPSKSAEEKPKVLAGKDLTGGGTWMGVSQDGRFALLTNYRDPVRFRANAKSRGLLVSDFLQTSVSAQEYLMWVRERAESFNDFNLLAGSPEGIFYLSSKTSEVRSIEPGLYGMSNHLFETPWPKVVRARAGLQNALKETDEKIIQSKLFETLSDSTIAMDQELPDTGVGVEKERALSSIFITMPGYGTRCSTLLLMKSNGEISFSERTYSSDPGQIQNTVEFRFPRQHDRLALSRH